MVDRRERIIHNLLGGGLDDFVIIGLEGSLELILKYTQDLLQKPTLQKHQFDDLIECYHDGKAMVRVLHYYTGDDYNKEKVLLNKAWDRMMGEFF